jgi:hypothetical protein
MATTAASQMASSPLLVPATGGAEGSEALDLSNSVDVRELAFV